MSELALPKVFLDNGNSSHIAPFTDISYYRLKHTDFDGKFQYFNIIAFKNCRENLTELNIYPNPENGIFNFVFRGDKDLVNSVSIYNILGEKVNNSKNYESSIDLSEK